MLSIFMQVATELGNNMELLFNIVSNGFQNLTFIGELLFLGVVFLASCVKTLLTSCIQGISIVLLEFFFFLRDIADLKNELAHFLTAGFNKCSNSIFSAITFVQNFSLCVYSTIWGIVDAIVFMLSSTLLFINSFLHLVGESFIVLFHAIFLDSSTLMIELVCLLKTSVVHTLGCVLTYFCSLVSSSVCHLYHLFKNMPVTSCLGFLVVVASFVLGKMYFSQITQTARLALLCTHITAWELLSEAKGLLIVCAKYLRWLLNCCITYLKNNRTSHPSTTCDQKLASNSEDLLRQLEIEREEKLCVVCRDRMKMFVLLPCRHYCLCQTCLNAILSCHASCPICRHYIQDSWKIFS